MKRKNKNTIEINRFVPLNTAIQTRSHCHITKIVHAIGHFWLLIIIIINNIIIDQYINLYLFIELNGKKFKNKTVCETIFYIFKNRHLYNCMRKTSPHLIYLTLLYCIHIFRKKNTFVLRSDRNKRKKCKP